jgi:hypothetical protein
MHIMHSICIYMRMRICMNIYIYIMRIYTVYILNCYAYIDRYRDRDRDLV